MIRFNHELNTWEAVLSDFKTWDAVSAENARALFDNGAVVVICV